MKFSLKFEAYAEVLSWFKNSPRLDTLSSFFNYFKSIGHVLLKCYGFRFFYTLYTIYTSIKQQVFHELILPFVFFPWGKKITSMLLLKQIKSWVSVLFINCMIIAWGIIHLSEPFSTEV